MTTERTTWTAIGINGAATTVSDLVLPVVHDPERGVIGTVSPSAPEAGLTRTSPFEELDALVAEGRIQRLREPVQITPGDLALLLGPELRKELIRLEGKLDWPKGVKVAHLAEGAVMVGLGKGKLLEQLSARWVEVLRAAADAQGVRYAVALADGDESAARAALDAIDGLMQLAVYCAPPDQTYGLRLRIALAQRCRGDTVNLRRTYDLAVRPFFKQVTWEIFQRDVGEVADAFIENARLQRRAHNQIPPPSPRSVTGSLQKPRPIAEVRDLGMQGMSVARARPPVQ